MTAEQLAKLENQETKNIFEPLLKTQGMTENIVSLVLSSTLYPTETTQMFYTIPSYGYLIRGWVEVSEVL